MTDGCSHENEGLLEECPSCSTAYRVRDMRLIYCDGQARVIHAGCRSCGAAMLFSVRELPEGLACAGIMTDLNYSDARQFMNARTISVDDVLAVHEALKLDNFPKIV